MMSSPESWNPVHGIVPPYVLEAIVKAAGVSPAVRAAAQQTLALTDSLRAARAAKSAALRSAMPVATAGAPRKNRVVYTASHGTTLPGSLVRSEGQGPSGDVTVDECYDGLGATWDLFMQIFGRNSIDDNGGDLIGTVHYGQSYNNAFWNGAQMVFGDGDGFLFNRFTIAVDVIGHELMHGITAHTADLDYSGQSGALNESMSDVFGSMLKQFVLKQTAAQADWLIGAGLFTANVHGVALRSMKAPGTAYDDPKLGGKDPQPADMAHYVTTASDNGGVHINSGIPNRAFYLLAVALGGHSWERAGQIWYATLRDPRLVHTASFQLFANLTCDNAQRLYGAQVKTAVIQAWAQVGIHVGKDVLGDTAVHAPGAVEVNNRLLVAWAGTDAQHHLNVIASAQHGSYTDKVTLGDTSPVGASLCLFGGKVYLAWTGTGNQHLNVMSSTDGKTWSNKVTLSDTSPFRPALAAHGGKIYLGWTGTDAQHRLNILSSADGVHWGGKSTLGDKSIDAPALASFLGRLYIGWTGTNDAHNLNVMSSADGGATWQNKRILGDTSIAGPSLCARDSRLLIGWAGRDGNHSLNVMASVNGLDFGAKLVLGDSSDNTPVLVMAHGQLTFVWTGRDTQHHLNVMPVPV